MNDGFMEDDFMPVGGEAPKEETKEETNDSQVASDEEISETSDEELSDDDSLENMDFDVEPRNVPDDIEKLDVYDFEDTDTGKKISPGKIVKIVVLVLIAALVVYIVIMFGFFENYKANFKKNISYIDSRLGISELFSGSNEDIGLKKKEENKASGTTYENESYLIPFENAGNAKYSAYDGGLLAAKSNYIALFDSKGAVKWETATSVVNPLLSVSGKYIILAEKGGTKVCLYDGSNLVYAADTQSNILNANVSSSGDAALVTEKDFYKGAVEVFNTDGKCVFNRSFGSDTIVCADVSPSSRKIAVGFIDTSGNVSGSVQLFDINETESYKTIDIPDAVVFRMEFIGETLNVFCDNRMIGITIHGDVSWDEQYGDSNVISYACDDKGMKALLAEVNNTPVIRVYSRSAGIKEEFSPEELPDYIDISDDILLYNNSRMVLFGKAGHELKYAATTDIKRLCIVDKKTYAIIYSNSIEFVKE